MTTCNECGGEGLLYFEEYSHAMDEFYFEEIECPTCLGTGEVNASPYPTWGAISVVKMPEPMASIGEDVS